MEGLKKCVKAVKQDPERDNSQLEIFPIAGDISDEAFVSNLATTVKTEFGRIDYVVNCAGILGPALRTDDTPIAIFDQINNINYKGTWLVNRKMLSRMKTQEPLAEHPLQKGAIVNIASQLGIVGRSEAGKPQLHDFDSFLKDTITLTVFSSSLLCLQSRHHPDDQVRCYRLLEGQHQGELRLSRSDRHANDYKLGRTQGTFAASGEYRSNAEDGHARRGC